MKVVVARGQRLAAVVTAVLAVMFGVASYATAAAPAVQRIDSQASLQGVVDMPALSTIQGTLHSSAKSATAADPVPFSCEAPPSTTPASVTYDSGSPAMLTRIDWTGSGSIECTIPMAALSFDIYVVDPEGTTHTVSEASCGECTGLATANTGYACLQSTQDCSGIWQQGYKAIYEAPAGETWNVSSGPCVAEGTLLTCDYQGFRGAESLFSLTEPYCSAAQTSQMSQTPLAGSGAAGEESCYNLPPSGNLPLLTLRAINNIRASHFEGGVNVDETKGLFLSSVTNRVLGQIYEAGLSDTGAWKLNSTGYYEKTFPYSGVGVRSEQYGNGLPSTQVTLVVEQYGQNSTNEVVTMYPADA